MKRSWKRHVNITDIIDWLCNLNKQPTQDKARSLKKHEIYTKHKGDIFFSCPILQDPGSMVTGQSFTFGFFELQNKRGEGVTKSSIPDGVTDLSEGGLKSVLTTLSFLPDADGWNWKSKCVHLVEKYFFHFFSFLLCLRVF